MKVKWKPLLLSLAVPLAVGGLSAFVTRRGMKLFQAVRQPPLSPPQWLFPIVWTILFLLMGTASYLVYTSRTARWRVRRALGVYGLQLAVNFLWTLLFFNWQAYLAAFLFLLLLWALIWVTFLLFRRIRKTAGSLLLPYLVWVAFAGYLNLGVYLLNR